MKQLKTIRSVLDNSQETFNMDPGRIDGAAVRFRWPDFKAEPVQACVQVLNPLQWHKACVNPNQNNCISARVYCGNLISNFADA